jgi:ribosome biogenesis GTPase
MARAAREGAAIENGRVVAAYGRRYRVELADGRELECVTRGRKSDIACGDRVRLSLTGAGSAVIESVEPRRTLFYRSDARREKLIAANVTQILIVVATQPPYYADLVNRCLVGAEAAGIAALIVLNKIDLPQADAVSASLDLYRALRYPVVPLSAKRDLTPLKSHLTGHLSVLVGQSGMGKSTIVNGLAPQAAARVAEISAALGSGRHTTTHAELYHLAGNADIIDSPGLQEFGLHHLSPEATASAFPEFRPFLGHCRFRNCGHLAEPGCAIADALAEGRLDASRVASYRQLARDLAGKRAHWQ